METSHFLQDVVMYLAAAVVAVSLSRRWGLGAVLGYLAAGALIGPYALNLARDVEATSQLSEFGVILLLFVIGLELSPQRLWLMRKAVFGAGLAQVVLSGLLLGGAALAFGLGWRSALIVGLALALSSTAIGLQLLAEHKQLEQSARTTGIRDPAVPGPGSDPDPRADPAARRARGDEHERRPCVRA